MIVVSSLLVMWLLAVNEPSPSSAQTTKRYCVYLPNPSQKDTYQLVDLFSNTLQRVTQTPLAANRLSTIANKRIATQTSADGKFISYFLLQDASDPNSGWYVIEPASHATAEKTIRLPEGSAVTTEGIRWGEWSVWTPYGHRLIHLSNEMPNHVGLPTLTVIDPSAMSMKVLPLSSSSSFYSFSLAGWSADGQYLVLNRRDYGVEQWVVLQLGTLQLIELPEFPNNSQPPVAWSPKGHQLAYIAPDERGETWLYLAEIPVGTVQKLVRAQPLIDKYSGINYIHWTGNSQEILFAQQGREETRDLVRFNINTSTLTTVVKSYIGIWSNVGQNKNRLLIVTQTADRLVEAGIWNKNGMLVQRLITQFDKVKEFDLAHSIVSTDKQNVLFAWQHGNLLRLRWSQIDGSQQLERDVQADQLEDLLLFPDNQTIGLQVQRQGLISVGTWDIPSNKLYWVERDLSQAVFWQYKVELDSNTLTTVFVSTDMSAHILSFGPKGRVHYKYSLFGLPPLKDQFGMPNAPRIYESPDKQLSLLVVRSYNSQYFYSLQLASIDKAQSLGISADDISAVAWSPDSQFVAYATEQRNSVISVDVVAANGEKIWHQTGFSTLPTFIDWQPCPLS